MNKIPDLMCSLIVPIYNGEKYIDRFVECLEEQIYPSDDYEVISVNDGSTDNSVQKLSDICKQFSNYVLINKSNGGVSSARNFGIRNSRGKYLIFADIDDCFGKEYISNLMSADFKYDLVSSGIRMERDNGREIIKRYPPMEYMKDGAQFFSSEVMKIWGGEFVIDSIKALS